MQISHKVLRQKIGEKVFRHYTAETALAKSYEKVVLLSDVLALLDLQEKELREKERKKEYAILTPSTEDEILAFIPIKEILGEKEA